MPRKRPDQTFRTSLGRSGMPGAIRPSHLGFQPAQKTPIIHASSGFIWRIPAYIMGAPHRMKYFRKIFEKIQKKKDALFWTGGEIADWYLKTGPKQRSPTSHPHRAVVIGP